MACIKLPFANAYWADGNACTWLETFAVSADASNLESLKLRRNGRQQLLRAIVAKRGRQWQRLLETRSYRSEYNIAFGTSGWRVIKTHANSAVGVNFREPEGGRLV